MLNPMTVRLLEVMSADARLAGVPEALPFADQVTYAVVAATVPIAPAVGTRAKVAVVRVTS